MILFWKLNISVDDYYNIVFYIFYFLNSASYRSGERLGWLLAP